MKKVIFLILGMVLLLTVWTQVSWGARELTLSIPPGWTPAQTLAPQQKLRAFLLNEQGIAQAELIFATEAVPASLDLQGYFREVSQSLPNFFQSYTPQETTPFELSGLSGLRHTFLFRVQGNPNELQGLSFLFLLDGQAYTLLFDCLSSQFSQLEPQFLQIAQGLTLGEAAATTPYTPSSQGLPNIGGGEGGGASSWTHQNPQGSFTIPLPQGASLSQELENGAVYATPNQGQLVILALDSDASLQGIVAQAVQGKNFQGASQLSTATGNPVQVALYTSQNPDTGVEYATLAGTFSGKALLVLVVLPVAEYQKAAGWIEALFTRAEIK
ncbi:MAG: hypothetical protein ACP5Q4_04140 [Candidatus Caldatribacteriaceae bacterium]